jgi:hypothetical protein
MSLRFPTSLSSGSREGTVSHENPQFAARKGLGTSRAVSSISRISPPKSHGEFFSRAAHDTSKILMSSWRGPYEPLS